VADNFTANPGSGGVTLAADDVGGVMVPRVKLQHGLDGTAVDASASAPLPVALPSAARTTALARVTTSGAVASGAKSAGFGNYGNANATVAGGTLAPGESVEFVAPSGDTLGAVAYDATGTVLVIAEVR